MLAVNIYTLLDLIMHGDLSIKVGIHCGILLTIMHASGPKLGQLKRSRDTLFSQHREVQA